MYDTHEQLKNNFERGDIKEFYTVNSKLYDQLYDAAHTKLLAGRAYRSRRRLSPCRIPKAYQPDRVHSTLKEILAILNAVK